MSVEHGYQKPNNSYQQNVIIEPINSCQQNMVIEPNNMVIGSINSYQQNMGHLVNSSAEHGHRAK
jgi:hypothetical protein